jgi:hypothetical protein
MTFSTILINFDTREEQILFENRAKRICLGGLWMHDIDDLWTEWSVDACTADDMRELLREDDYTKDDIPDDEYDRRLVEEEFCLEDGELDGVSIREAEERLELEEGELDRFIFDFDGYVD